ncbi:hypothetical protein JCM18920_3276 [Cutibacterium acnes JCM 18920]|nr:hypothetical protein JCM18920_3276 [Cutibacterium acnes JCM 18920]
MSRKLPGYSGLPVTNDDDLDVSPYGRIDDVTTVDEHLDTRQVRRGQFGVLGMVSLQ